MTTEEQTAVFEEQPETVCDLVEIEGATSKEQAGFNSIQSAIVQSSSLGIKANSRKMPHHHHHHLPVDSDNLIQFDSPKKVVEGKESKTSEDKECKCGKIEPQEGSTVNNAAADGDDEGALPAVVVDESARSLDKDTIGRVTAEMISPREFICPITTKIMKQPVRAPDGFVYEKRAISEWIERHGLSPISRTQMKIEDLVPEENVAIKVKEWRKKRRLQRQKMETQLNKAKDLNGRLSKVKAVNGEAKAKVANGGVPSVTC